MFSPLLQILLFLFSELFPVHTFGATVTTPFDLLVILIKDHYSPLYLDCQEKNCAVAWRKLTVEEGLEFAASQGGGPRGFCVSIQACNRDEIKGNKGEGGSRYAFEGISSCPQQEVSSARYPQYNVKLSDAVVCSTPEGLHMIAQGCRRLPWAWEARKIFSPEGIHK
ncbi:MAG: hypothetical protein HZA01_08835 [Nitrospinae bacterium]|nr:hypothetical protein [Nitrospinota bacterium]